MPVATQRAVLASHSMIGNLCYHGVSFVCGARRCWIADLPAGTVTFLFTDIEGSTRLWEQHPQAMADALARHDVILRQATAAHEGVVFRTVGDTFCIAFASAPQALGAALDAQRALAGEAWGR